MDQSRPSSAFAWQTPVFFIAFRESLETAIIVSVLLAFIKRAVSSQDDAAAYQALARQVWLGTAAGLLVLLIVGTAIITGINGLAAETFAGAEDIWEGTFAIVASLAITIMGAMLLRVSKLQDKWRVKLSRALDARENQASLSRGRFKDLAERYGLFLLPFITVLREGFEGVLFVAGVGLGLPASSIALPLVLGLLAGALVGFFIYKGSNAAPVKTFLIFSTCFLYLLAAGLFSDGVWHLEAHEWNKIVGGDAAELGSGPGSYDIRKSVWHVNCCNPSIDVGGFWGIFNMLLGWQNSATVGSVVAYNLYWVAVTAGFLAITFRDNGYTLSRKTKAQPGNDDRQPLLSRAPS